MNEQFTKLAIQAAGKGLQTFATSDFDSQEKIQKFAELIVRECTNMLPEDSIRNADGVHMFYVIREHFGVEK